MRERRPAPFDVSEARCLQRADQQPRGEGALVLDLAHRVAEQVLEGPRDDVEGVPQTRLEDHELAARLHDPVELLKERGEPDVQEMVEEQRARHRVEGAVGVAGIEDVPFLRPHLRGALAHRHRREVDAMEGVRDVPEEGEIATLPAGREQQVCGLLLPQAFP